MSECVVRMEMPEDCLRCPMVHFDTIGNLQGCEAKPGKRYLQGKEDEFWEKARPSWCPILCQLPEGHGRLIDAEKLKAKKYHSDITHENAVSVAEIDWAEIIIPAEPKEDE